ncbi:uncharacterized protein EDB91DRAFT_1249165 [Suillus paluster]|uniref:uncharacterized protein n=1 Tax=Suillus paluster TaxID=48578 RepID=UPI001B8797D6|nr:uncharacterized protein EDB91DRAFT_1249165 [Suillus paluster]KAG1738633.1 hypothetical protein EDB91DRAFT_1249165 [Suillus paluster]
MTGLFLPQSRIQLANLLRVTTVARPRTMGMPSANTKRVHPSSKHVSVKVTPDSGKKIRVGSERFIGEPLGLPVQGGFGPDDCCVVCRKLVWGMSSRTWLARDKTNNSCVAIKVLTGTATDLVRQRIIRETETLYQVSSPSSPHCLKLLSDFTNPGKGSSGEHVCSNFIASPPLPNVSFYTLCGIAHAHSRGVLHTDLRPENIFFDTRMSGSDFDKLLESHPSRRHSPEESYDGMMQAAVSQPLPVPTLQEAMQRTFVLTDFGNGKSVAMILLPSAELFYSPA